MDNGPVTRARFVHQDSWRPWASAGFGVAYLVLGALGLVTSADLGQPDWWRFVGVGFLVLGVANLIIAGLQRRRFRRERDRAQNQLSEL
jgi:hypothetical protein